MKLIILIVMATLVHCESYSGTSLFERYKGLLQDGLGLLGSVDPEYADLFPVYEKR